MQDNEFIINNIKQRGIPFEEIFFTDDAISARTTDTSKDHNYDPANSIKTIIVEGKAGVFQLLLGGNDSIDQQKVKELIGRWRILPMDVVERDYGLIIGGICPVTVNLPSIVDSALIDRDLWGMGAGDIKHGLNIKRDDAVMNMDVFKLADIRRH